MPRSVRCLPEGRAKRFDSGRRSRRGVARRNIARERAQEIVPRGRGAARVPRGRHPRFHVNSPYTANSPSVPMKTLPSAIVGGGCGAGLRGRLIGFGGGDRVGTAWPR